MQDYIPQNGEFDVFRDLDKWSEQEACYWAELLNQRAAEPSQIELRARILSQSAIKPGDSVLELGCGTGRLLSELARKTGHSGRVFGLDPQPFFVKEAEDFVHNQKLDSNTRVLLARAEEIPLPDNSIDHCVAQTTLIHIPAHLLNKVFTEVRRVLKPMGKLVSVDQDGDTWIIDHPDRVTTRKIIQFNTDYRYADGWTGRRLRRLFKLNGFEEVQVSVWTHLDTKAGSYLHQMAHRIASTAAIQGAISNEEYKNWLHELDKQVNNGNFFSTISHFVTHQRTNIGMFALSCVYY